MKIGQDNEFCELTETERVLEEQSSAGNVKVKVNISLQEFTGSYSEVWFNNEKILEFISQLEKLNLSRKGRAKIESISPEEFMLEIKSSDSLGHMEAEVFLQRYQYSGQKYRPVKISGYFEVDSIEINKLLTYFKCFLN